MNALSNIPSQPHFAIIRETSVHIPGDERSRTNPGHGYPERTETFITYEAFTDCDKWKKEIARLTLGNDSFRAISVTPATVTTSVSVTVS